MAVFFSYRMYFTAIGIHVGIGVTDIILSQRLCEGAAVIRRQFIKHTVNCNLILLFPVYKLYYLFMIS